MMNTWSKQHASGRDTQEQQTQKTVGGEMTIEENHENGKVKNIGESPKRMLVNSRKENWEKEKGSGGNGESLQGVTKTQHNVIPKFEFKQA